MALDFSPFMLERLQSRLGSNVQIVSHNLDHVSSASAYGHARFLEAMGITPEDEDPSNKLLDVHTQLQWLRAIGFADVDCYWKWRELALLVGSRRSSASGDR